MEWILATDKTISDPTDHLWDSFVLDHTSVAVKIWSDRSLNVFNLNYYDLVAKEISYNCLVFSIKQSIKWSDRSLVGFLLVLEINIIGPKIEFKMWSGGSHFVYKLESFAIQIKNRNTKLLWSRKIEFKMWSGRSPIVYKLDSGNTKWNVSKEVSYP
jgi:hypothetical protein